MSQETQTTDPNQSKNQDTLTLLQGEREPASSAKIRRRRILGGSAVASTGDRVGRHRAADPLENAGGHKRKHRVFSGAPAADSSRESDDARYNRLMGGHSAEAHQGGRAGIDIQSISNGLEAGRASGDNFADIIGHAEDLAQPVDVGRHHRVDEYEPSRAAAAETAHVGSHRAEAHTPRHAEEEYVPDQLADAPVEPGISLPEVAPAPETEAPMNPVAKAGVEYLQQLLARRHHAA